MLRSLKELEWYEVSATDGDVGSVVNFLLDDTHWIVRYLVVEILGTVDRQQVLITPIAFREVDWSKKQFHLTLTRDKLKNSVSAYPGLLADGSWKNLKLGHTRKSADIHLRSASELRGYHIQGSDDPIGHVEDFIIDDLTWEVRYLVINTSNWWFGKKVLIAPHWATRINWQERNVYVGMNRQAIRNSPEWSATEAVGREYEASLHKHYGRKAYWDDGDRRVWVPPTQQHPE